LQQLLQADAQPHDGSAAQPQEGAAAAQAGSAAQPHEGAAAQLLQLLQLLQDFLQPQPKNLSCRCPSTLQWRLHRDLQHEGAAQQEASAAQQDCSAAQLGAAAQAGSQPLSQPQDGAFWQQLLQPQSFRPIMRSKSSKPKLWLHRPTLTTSAPKTMFHFIEQRLLYLNCG
jgi:hypothetical protein